MTYEYRMIDGMRVYRRKFVSPLNELKILEAIDGPRRRHGGEPLRFVINPEEQIVLRAIDPDNSPDAAPANGPEVKCQLQRDVAIPMGYADVYLSGPERPWSIGVPV